MSVIYRSPTVSFVSGGVLPINLNFLDPARKMSAPVIERLLLRCNFSVTVGTAKTPVQRLSEIYSKVYVADAAGDRCNVRGSSLHVINQMENGLGYADGSKLAISGTRTGSFFMEVPFTPRKCRRRNDFGLNLLEFLDGGQITLNLTSSSTLGGTNEISAIGGTTTFEVYAVVREERHREAKSRIVWLDYDISQTEFTYPVNGSLRYAIMYAGEVAEHNATTWGSQNITSRTVDYSQIPDVVLSKLYQLESEPRVGDPLGLSATAAVETEDEIVAGYALPIVFPRLDQKTGEMFDMTGFHLKTDLSSITTSNLPKLIICAITDRQSQLTARTLGAPSQDALAGATAKFGRIKTAAYGTADEPISKWAPQVVRRLPYRLVKP